MNNHGLLWMLHVNVESLFVWGLFASVLFAAWWYLNEAHSLIVNMDFRRHFTCWDCLTLLQHVHWCCLSEVTNYPNNFKRRNNWMWMKIHFTVTDSVGLDAACVWPVCDQNLIWQGSGLTVPGCLCCTISNCWMLPGHWCHLVVVQPSGVCLRRCPFCRHAAEPKSSGFLGVLAVGL